MQLFYFSLLTGVFSYGNIDNIKVVIRNGGIKMTSIYNYEHPFVCTDAVVFRINTQEADSYRKLPEPKLSVLLYNRPTEPSKGKWCLPGGFLNIDETPEDNIRRKLSEKSQLTECYLEQLYTFSDVKRDERGRVISIAHLGLVREGDGDMNGEWFTVDTTGNQITFSKGDIKLTANDLGFDHYNIIQTALERLRAKLRYSDIVFHLLPSEFTLTQVQNVYEAIQGKKEVAANFRRKIAHLVQETDRYTSDKGHRPAKIFVKNPDWDK